MTDGQATISDKDIVLMMAMGEEDGLRLFLQRYAGRMSAFLMEKYGKNLHDAEREEALCWAAHNIWRFADRYDESKGELSSWCIRITQRAAQSVLRREMKYCSKHHEYNEDYDPAASTENDGNHDQIMAISDPRWPLLLKAIENLQGLQKAIIKADLAANGTADAQRLAEIHGTTKNSIWVSRNKAHENLKKRVDELARKRS